jgi:hypothetical protein
MPELTLHPTWPDGSRVQLVPDDFQVHDGGDSPIGRIYLVHGSRPRWMWALYGASGTYGHAPTLESALSAFKVAYLAWKGAAGPAA